MSTAPEPTSVTPTIVTTTVELRRRVADARRQGRTIGVVPTMGALHRGHISLVEACRAECDFCVVTIFVNPTQFGPHEDFSRYPRQLEKDTEMVVAAGADLVFAPSVEEVYPRAGGTTVEVHGVTEMLEGPLRPGHFQGVATIVLKLFQMVGADRAYFGHKDYQQSVVIRRMVLDLNVPITIRVCPTIREADGLALSSRNIYLNASERASALALSRSLFRAVELVAGGQRQTAALLSAMHAILAEHPEVRVQYVAIVDPDTLAPVEMISPLAIALIAAHVGTTRLIDNVRLESV